MHLQGLAVVSCVSAVQRQDSGLASGPETAGAWAGVVHMPSHRGHRGVDLELTVLVVALAEATRVSADGTQQDSGTLSLQV